MRFRHRSCTYNLSISHRDNRISRQITDFHNSSFPPPVVPVSLPPPPSSASSSSLVLRTPTPPPPVPPRPLRTPSRPPSSLSPTPTASSPPTCGRRPSSSAALSRSSLTLSARRSVTRRIASRYQSHRRETGCAGFSTTHHKNNITFFSLFRRHKISTNAGCMVRGRLWLQI